MQETLRYDKIKIRLASPSKIREWSRGEVKKPETINYRTLKPEKDGLYCEKIFGPSKDWECHCGKYKKVRYKGVVCDRCGVEVTKSSVRRERMGHIELAAPVSHIWYFKGIPSRMGLVLDISPKVLEKVLYFAAYIVLESDVPEIKTKQILSEAEYTKAREDYGDAFRVGMGAESIQELLQRVDLDEEAKTLKAELKTSTGQKRARIIKRLEVVEAFRESGNKPDWMILTVIPVIPPDLRPMVQLDGGRFATSDMNDLYRRIINRNNRLKRLLELGAPDIIVRNEKRMLQEAVDALIDNGRRGRPVTGPGNRALKSLSDMLKGKQGRFRQNLLGKRVDYSGRSVIVVGPELKIYQCGLPKEMAIELFKPFVMKELVDKQIAHNIKNAKKMVEKLEPAVWDILEKVIKEHPVMLNRAPTLHRLGIQAFEPTLVEGKAIKLHPLVCTAFNADFDGDQMAVHLPLSVEAQAECRFLLLSPNNLLKPSDGGPVAVPSQDMVLGIYYLTQERPGSKGEGKIFKNMNEAIIAYENQEITLHAKVKIRREGINSKGEVEQRVIESTLGRFIFNEILPENLGFIDKSLDENFLKLEVDFHVGKKQLKQILEKCINNYGATQTAETLDAIKSLGYKYSTRAAMTVSISDMKVPESKSEILSDAESTVEEITTQFRRGLLTEEERYKAVIETWNEADNQLTHALMDGLDAYNNIFMMADSGARGSQAQIKQLAGMRGLMADTTGRTIELPIKSNFREGLDVLEYFISAHGARKGLSDTALRTADSGYLTRRLVDVSQELIIRETDCCEGTGEIPGMEISAFMEGKEVIESLEERITGRYACEDMYDDNGELIVKANHMITRKRAAKIVNTKAIIDAGVKAKVKIRTNLTCRSHIGICAKCYGSNMATGEPVQVGEAVGIIAAQSIGEPGTQLTMRTFHTGGVAGDDITQGLPRVEELFEARKPKGLAIISEIAGIVEIKDTKKKREVIVRDDENGQSKTYLIPYGSRIKVMDGQDIEAGDELTEGSVNPHDILKIKGIRAVQDYMLREVQRVYRLQGVEINDKHIEVIVRQMLKKIRIENNGDSNFLPGTLVDILEFDDMVKELTEQGLEPPEGKRIILGITKASLATNSFLSAASFQETTKVLTDAAIKGKVDPLIGLKENVLIGKLIPAGTGMKRYRNISLYSDLVDSLEPPAKVPEEEEVDFSSLIPGENKDEKSVFDSSDFDEELDEEFNDSFDFDIDDDEELDIDDDVVDSDNTEE
ncbi:DNA-directed RNA polymerase subunit beta' [Eubacterium xylanophilum]|uniref:DNA-directed RNA polymerase subunit beta' n=1 Tax=Eubacterium xylanophilum TaxID=39497 RepID=UPI003BFA1019